MRKYSFVVCILSLMGFMKYDDFDFRHFKPVSYTVKWFNSECEERGKLGYSVKLHLRHKQKNVCLFVRCVCQGSASHGWKKCDAL